MQNQVVEQQNIPSEKAPEKAYYLYIKSRGKQL